MPKKQGNVYVYDIPNHVHQDYDVLPSSLRRISDALPSYDVPSALRSPVETNSDPIDNYDTLPAVTRNMSQPSEIPHSSATVTHDIPPTHPASGFDLDPTLLSSRLSTLSVLSAGSHSSAYSGHSSMSGSMSTQTNMDVSVQDIDDVLSCSRLDAWCNLHSVTEQGMFSKSNDSMKTPLKHCMQSSVASSCAKKEPGRQSSAGPPSNLRLHADRDSYLEDYSVPRSDISQSSGDSGISVSQVDSFSSHCFGEIYDTPRKLTDARLHGGCNIQNLEESKYDIPHQMSETSDGKSSSDERVDTNSCVEISSSCLQVADAMSTLNAIQSNVLCHGSKLIDLISKDYLGSHQQELPQIKLTCLALKSAIKEAIESGNILLSQIMNPGCKELSDRIAQLLEKLRVQFRYLNRHTDRLLMTQWTEQVVDCGGGEISELDDNLNTIEMLTEYISARLLALTRFIMHNSSLLDSKTPKVYFCDCAKSDVAKTFCDESIYKMPLLLNEGTLKARSDLMERQSLVQNRPLPPIPVPKSTLQDSQYSKHHASKNAVQGINHAASSSTSLQRNNLSEWNDDCDYVSIANEAESELRAQEKLLGQQSPIKSASESCSEAKVTVKTTAEGNTVFGLMAENISGRLEQMNESKNIHASSNSSLLSDNQRVESTSTVSVSPDQRLMPYYMEQIESSITTVDTAVREFFQVMFNDHVTAKEFLLCSRFVILAAHKLVYIGDTITRNSTCSSASQNDVAQKANRLCNLLKETVAVTKTLALNFPQNVAQEKLKECMKAVLQGSHLLCEAIRLNSA